MRVKDPTTIRALFGSPRQPAIEAELADLIASTGALLEGHFRLQSGAHSPYFLRFGQLAYAPNAAARVAELVVDVLEPPPGPATVVLCAETAARFLGTALAEAIGAGVALAQVDERRQPCPSLRRGSIDGRPHVVIATDVVTTGRSLGVLVELARSTPDVESVRVVSFACLAPGGMEAALAPLRVEGACLLQGRWTSYAATDCALCRDDVPLVPAFEFN